MPPVFLEIVLPLTINLLSVGLSELAKGLSLGTPDPSLQPKNRAIVTRRQKAITKVRAAFKVVFLAEVESVGVWFRT